MLRYDHLAVKRRPYLASLATLTGSAGCLGTTTSFSPSPRSGTTVSLSNVEPRLPETIETVPEDERPSDLAFDAAITRETVTPDAPARIALEYTNTGSETLTPNIDPDHPAPVPSTATNPGLVLLSAVHDPIRRTSTCWKPEDDTFGHFAVANQYPIEPGDTETIEHRVWAAPEQDADCIQAGNYRFEPLYGVFTLTVRQ